MARTLTALYVTPGVTYCTTDGSEYRADWTGIVHVEGKHVTELTTKTAPPGATQARTATVNDLKGTAHQGAPLSLVVEN